MPHAPSPLRVILVALLVLPLLLVCSACGGTKTTTVTTTKTVTTTVTAPATKPPATVPAMGRTTVSIYLLRGEQLGVAHRVVDTPGVALGAMRQLLLAPSAADRAAGLGTSIPGGTRVLGVTVAGDTATVDLTGRFQSGGGSVSMLARVAQVVYTLTQVPGIERVAFHLDGRAVDAIGGEGVIVSPPVTRAGFEGQAPPILVEAPEPGDRAASPLRVTGTANVFETVLFVELRDAGRVVATQRVMASSGTGMRGAFSATLRHSRAALTRPVLIAYDRSAKDGSRQDVVRIPLAP